MPSQGGSQRSRFASPRTEQKLERAKYRAHHDHAIAVYFTNVAALIRRAAALALALVLTGQLSF